MPDIFITHSQSDAAFAKKISTEIEAAGYNVQISKSAQLKSVKEYIKKTSFFIPICSVDFWKDNNLIEQCKLAITHHKAILPLQLSAYDELDWNIIPPKISNLRWFDFLGEDLYKESTGNLISYIHKHQEYLKTYSQYYNAALLWERFGYQIRHLLSHNEVEKAISWLQVQKDRYKDLPSEPTLLHSAYISESRRNIENETADIFITHTDKPELEEKLIYALQRKGVTCISRLQKFHQGVNVDKAIENCAVCVVVSAESKEAKDLVQSEIRYAETLNKPILSFQVSIGEYEKDYSPIELENVKYGLLPNFDSETSEYLRYYTKILQRARIWQSNNQPKQSLLYGHNLTLSSKWLNEGINRLNYHPLGIHEEYIEESTQFAHNFSPEVFVANAANNLLFTKKLNAHLQKHGKVTYWPFERLTFDQNAEEVIYHGITSSDIFVIILSTHTIKRGDYKKEILYAKRLHKKIIGVLIEEIDEADFPSYLKGIGICQFIEEEKPFEESLKDLLSRLENHQEYERSFNKVNQWTTNWLKHDKSVDFLIPENEIDGVEKWYHQAVGSNRIPAPTILHQEFIEESRQHASHLARQEHKKLVQFRVALAVAVLMLIVSFALLFNTISQNRQIQTLLTETQKAKELEQKQGDLLAIQLDENKLLLDSLRGLDQFARLQEHERDSIVSRYLSSRDYQENLQEENEVLAQENSYYKGDIKVVDFMKDLRSRYIDNQNDKAVINAYFDVVMSRRLRPGHKGSIFHITASPDAKFVLTAGGDGKAMILDIDKNRVRTFLQNRYNGAVNSAVFSRNGNQILTASHDGSAILWDVAKVKPITKFKCGHNVKHASFAPNKKWVVTAEENGTVTIWDIRSSRMLKKLDHKKGVNAAIFSKDSKLVFTAGQDGVLRKWDLKNGTELEVVKLSYPINSVVLAPNGRDLLVSVGNKALVLNVYGETLIQFKGHSANVLHANYSSKGDKIVTSSKDRTARVWDKNGNLICVLGRNREHLGAITSASFSGDGEKVFTSSMDHTIRMWLLSPQEVFEGDNLERYLEIGAD